MVKNIASEKHCQSKTLLGITGRKRWRTEFSQIYYGQNRTNKFTTKTKTKMFWGHIHKK